MGKGIEPSSENSISSVAGGGCETTSPREPGRRRLKCSCSLTSLLSSLWYPPLHIIQVGKEDVVGFGVTGANNGRGDSSSACGVIRNLKATLLHLIHCFLHTVK